MKFSQKAMESSIHHQEVAVDIKYNTDNGTLHRGDPESIYCQEVFLYQEEMQVKLAANMKEALIRRGNQELVFTIREIDIAARRKIDLSPESYTVKFMLSMGGCPMISEFPHFGPEDENIFALRQSWNVGLHWKQNIRPKKSVAIQEKGDQRLRELFDKMAKISMHPWPNEERNGFPNELLKPEWCSWSQWERIKNEPTILSQ